MEEELILERTSLCMLDAVVTMTAGSATFFRFLRALLLMVAPRLTEDFHVLASVAAFGRSTLLRLPSSW